MANYPLVSVEPTSGYGEDRAACRAPLHGDRSGAFSACTVFRGARRTIVHNDAHAPGRQASNLTHELGHALLHPPTPALDDRGCRLWNQNIEDEAHWLAGALLLTEDAALCIARNDTSVPAAAEHFGISEQMITYRLNVTGAGTRAARALRLGVVR
jgi:Zn-dependent peptidase ImmA (M78 family)